MEVLILRELRAHIAEVLILQGLASGAIPGCCEDVATIIKPQGRHTTPTGAMPASVGGPGAPRPELQAYCYRSGDG
jgi:hypothetical protein